MNNMKKLLLIMGLLVAGINAYAGATCLTNVVINCLNGGQVLINGSSNYNILQNYTTASSPDLAAQSCDDGTVLTFSLNDCPSSATDVATVSWACDTSISCGGGPCASGNHFTITMPANCNYYSIRVYSFLGCCTLTKCDLYAGMCDPR